MMRRLAFALKVLWLSASIALLGFVLSVFDGTPNSDASIVLGYGLLVLTFPLGVALAFIEGAVGRAAYEIFGLVATTSIASLIATWLVYTVVGYAQWFLLPPWVIRKLKGRANSRRLQPRE